MRQCQICGKGSIVRVSRKKLRGKYNPTNSKRKYPNLQYTRLHQSFGGQASPKKGKRVLACTKCIKKLSRIK